MSTCMSAHLLYACGAVDSRGNGYFTHVFIDEAGQSTEPETLVSVAGLLRLDGLLVLSGDPRQLGPVIHSRLAINFGLGRSMLERIERSAPYAAQPHASGEGEQRDPVYCTKLLRNYRSHPDILAYPSRLFYANELQPFADKEERSMFCGWKELPCAGVPVIFRGVQGKEEREAKSPSWFNASKSTLSGAM